MLPQLSCNLFLLFIYSSNDYIIFFYHSTGEEDTREEDTTKIVGVGEGINIELIYLNVINIKYNLSI